MPVELQAEPIDAARQTVRMQRACVPQATAVASLAPTFVVEYSAHALPADLAAKWDDLSAAAVVPNAFYDRWNATAALHELTPDVDVRMVCVFHRSPETSGAAELCGLFPLVRARSSRMSIAVWRLWGHRYCYLQTPLVRRGQERLVLESLMDWAAGQSPHILDWSLLDGEGPLAQALVDVLRERQMLHLVADRYNRALLQRQPDWEAAIATRLSSHHRRELRRQHRRLEEQGQLTLRTLSHAGELERWTGAFVRLEASGWKGMQQTAMGADPAAHAYLSRMLRAGLSEGRVQMLGLFLGDEPVALKLNLHAGPGSFAFKIAYQEQLAKFSPGVQLELENVRVLHEATDLRWMDSCAVANHFMINRLWSGRRTIQRVLISTGGRLANLAVGALPLCQALKRTFCRTPAVADRKAD